LELITRNADLFRQIVASMEEIELAEDAVLLVVTNPVDVLTGLAATDLGWNPRRAIGLGTALDTLRFRSLLGEELALEPAQIDALMLGEHGDSMVPILSQIHYAGRPIDQAPGYSEEAVRRAVERTRGAGAECLRLKGGAGYAVGLAIRQVVEAILDDSGATLPVSTLDESGEYEGVALSRPTRVGRAGWLEYAPFSLSEEEHRRLRASAEVLRETMARVQAGA
jgi:L-lactate dehydrogenase